MQGVWIAFLLPAFLQAVSSTASILSYTTASTKESRSVLPSSSYSASTSKSPSISTSKSYSPSSSYSQSVSPSTSYIASRNESQSISPSLSGLSESQSVVSAQSRSLSTSPTVTPSLSSSSQNQSVSTSFLTSLPTSLSSSGSESASLSISASKSVSFSVSMSFSVVQSNMYPYGLDNGDSEFRFGDSYYYYSGHCLKLKVDRFGFPFFSERHYKLHICRNGKIQLNYEWSFWWPQKFGVYRWFRNFPIIAPLWALTDQYLAFKAGYSKVYYRVYSQVTDPTRKTLDKASNHVQRFGNSGAAFSNFQAEWVLVVTWENLCPYVYYPWYYYYYYSGIPKLDCPWSNTFQAVIITDFLNSFVIFNYPRGGIQWVAPVLPYYYRYWTGWYGIPAAGWNAGDNGEHYLNMKGSRNLYGMYDLDKRAGNTGLTGSYFWRIDNSDVGKALERCLSWARFQYKIHFLYWHERFVKWDWRMACPCSGWQAWWDRRFFWNWRKYSWPDWCFESRRSKWIWFYISGKAYGYLRMKQLCCYSTDWQNWASLKTGPPDGSHVQTQLYYYHHRWVWNRDQTVDNDQQSYKYCCVDIPFCNLFYRFRPSDNCQWYRPPRRRWFWGDPHFKTLDGGNYTFNGLGEYVMIDAQNGTFQLQARTNLAQGNSTTATIFAAGAAKEENTSIVEVRVKKGGGIDILIDHTIYSNYSGLTNDSVSVGSNLSISKPEDNCLEVSFPSLTSVKFCEKKEMMSFIVTPGDDYKNTTKGLLGTWNDNPDDDFTLPDGTELPSSLTLKEIHFNFGVKWQINQSQSLFTYAPNESVHTFSKPDFEPMFADNITWHNDSLRQEAEEQCGDDHECLFDVASTNDLSVGMVTKDISVQLVNETNALDNFPPKIVSVSSEINATLHKTVQLNITAEDEGTITFRVINKPSSAIVNTSGNILLFTWSVTSTKKFNLSFVATDDKGASATWSPRISMCACDHGGQCVSPEEGDEVNTDSKFVYMGCACQGGYTGRFCDSDIDACEMNGQPCYAGVNCTDLPAPANVTGYTCGPCPTGFTGNGAQCADLDECRSNTSNICEQDCVNVPGSFTCDCGKGYKLNEDGHSCDDINECEPTNDCMQTCTNTDGGYNCSCDAELFKTDPNDLRKCVAKNPCSSDPGCDHVCYAGTNDKPSCTCFANYKLQSNGKTCKDIDECDPDKSLQRCNQICENTPGSYKCSCEKGFEIGRDGYTCEDINECVNDDLFNCTDEFHVCVNTRGSYKCVCGQNLYFIDGKCRGLEINESIPVPKLEEPRQPNTKEKENAVEITIAASNEFKWDFDTDKSFKEKTAVVTTSYCTENRTECALKQETRTRRALDFELYIADYVHLLPGYPSNGSVSLAVAFYVQQPPGLFIGNNSILPSHTLVDIIVLYKSELEGAIGATISSVKALFTPTGTTTTRKPIEESENNNWKWIVIGVIVGIFFIILIAFVIWRIKKKPSKVKPDEVPEDVFIMDNYNSE